MPELRQEREELERLEAKLSRLIEDDAGRSEPRAQIDRVETARANVNKTRSLMLLRMRQVLTPEQRDALRSAVQAMGHVGGQRDRAGHRRRPEPERPQGKPAPSDSQRRPG